MRKPQGGGDKAVPAPQAARAPALFARRSVHRVLHDCGDRAMTLALAPIRDKFERALRNGERLHLEIDQVRIIARTPIWPMLADLTAKELARSEEHTSELQSLMRTSYAVFCLTKQTT